MVAAGGSQSSVGGASRPAPADPTFTMLHDFAGPSGDGANSGAGVTLDNLGNICRTTDYGGAANAGAIFELAPNGPQTLLHSFGGTGDGINPDGAVTIDPSTGDIYGGTEQGGADGYGVIYRLTADGAYTACCTASTGLTTVPSSEDNCCATSGAVSTALPCSAAPMATARSSS